MPPRAFLRVDHLERDAHTFGHAREMPVAIHLGFGIGKTDATVAMVVIDRIIGIFGEFLVKPDRMAFQPDHRLGHAEIGDLCRGMPCGSRCQLVPLDQHDISPAFLRQMVER